MIRSWGIFLKNSGFDGGIALAVVNVMALLGRLHPTKLRAATVTSTYSVPAERWSRRNPVCCTGELRHHLEVQHGSIASTLRITFFPINVFSQMDKDMRYSVMGQPPSKSGTFQTSRTEYGEGSPTIAKSCGGSASSQVAYFSRRACCSALRPGNMLPIHVLQHVSTTVSHVET